jgi:CHAD domain-containing protein
MLAELKKVQRDPGVRGERPYWRELTRQTEKEHRRAAKKFLKRRKSFDVKRTASRIKQAAKKEHRSERIMEDLGALLEGGWSKWLSSIDNFIDEKTATALHRVRIKSKALRYALDLTLRLYPDSELQRDSNWLKEIQDQIGAWHDELALGQRALKTFAKLPRDAKALKVIRRIKEKEIRLAEAAQKFIVSVRADADYKRLRRRLSASVFAMSNGNRRAQRTSEQLPGTME